MSCRDYESYDEYMTEYERYVGLYYEACRLNSDLPPAPLPPCNGCETGETSACDGVTTENNTSTDRGSLELFVNYPGPLSRVKTFRGRIILADRSGKIVILNEDKTFETILDITDRVKVDIIAGFLNFEFAPWFDEQPSVYVWYSTPGFIPEDGSTVTIVSTFSVDRDTLVVDKESEVRLLNVWNPTGAHVGGELRFLSDRSLLVGLGEGGRAEPVYYSQEDNTLLGKFLRYDVDYSLITFGGINDVSLIMRSAAGNPDPESPVFAKGTRNPYSTTEICVKSRTPEIISYQNGDSAWEMITHVQSGDNLGWPCYEGFEKTGFFLDRCEFPLENLKTPFLVYPHSDPTSPDRPRPWVKTGASISPGFIYKGTQFPSWSNAILFGDLTKKLFFAKKDNRYKYEYEGRYAFDNLPVTNLDIIPEGDMLIFVDPGLDAEPLVTTYSYVTNNSAIYKIQPLVE